MLISRDFTFPKGTIFPAVNGTFNGSFDSMEYFVGIALRIINTKILHVLLKIKILKELLNLLE